MRIGFVRWTAALAAAGSLVGGFAVGQAAAAPNAAPVVAGGTMTVRYEDVYTVHFTASDPEGAPLTVVTPPVNDDWISCDDGPANDFTCDYSSSRYGDPEPLPTQAFQRTITYSVSDGTTTSTGVWTVTVLPPRPFFSIRSLATRRAGIGSSGGRRELHWQSLCGQPHTGHLPEFSVE